MPSQEKAKNTTLVEHVANKLYDNRFADGEFKRTRSWQETKIFDPAFAACYLDSAQVAVRAIREFKAN